MPYSVHDCGQFDPDLSSLQERRLHGTRNRHRYRARHRNPGGRGVHRRHVRGLLTVAVPAPAEARFDPELGWRLHPQVAVRPEPFGALMYHFGTRKLSFLKNTTMLAVVRSLTGQQSARSACAAAGVTASGLPAYERALAALAESRMIVAGEQGAAGPGGQGAAGAGKERAAGAGNQDVAGSRGAGLASAPSRGTPRAMAQDRAHGPVPKLAEQFGSGLAA